MIQHRLSSITEDCASTINRDCGGHRETEDQSVEDVTERTSVPQTVCRNSLSYQEKTGLTAQMADRSVRWSEPATGHADEEAIMQILGAGHSYLEGWIGDHAVDFLVDLGSAVTAVSNSFYRHLRDNGAPVGEIRPTNRRLCGANGGVRSSLYADGMAGGLTNDLLWSNPWGT